MWSQWCMQAVEPVRGRGWVMMSEERRKLLELSISV